MLMQQGVIYELLDPRTSDCRYVGQTFSPDARRRQHQARAFCRQRNDKLALWKDELVSLGLRPVFQVIEDGLTAASINERERFWCKQRTDLGFQLFNRPVGAIGKESLFSQAERAAAAMAAREIVDVVSALHNSLSPRLPGRHKVFAHLAEAIRELQRAKDAIEP